MAELRHWTHPAWLPRSLVHLSQRGANCALFGAIVRSREVGNRMVNRDEDVEGGEKDD